MTASVVKQDPNTKRFKRTLIYYDTDRLALSYAKTCSAIYQDKTQHANFLGNPLYQATK